MKQVKQKARIVRWKCSKCGVEWSQSLIQSGEWGDRPNLPECTNHNTLCALCLDRIEEGVRSHLAKLFSGRKRKKEGAKREEASNNRKGTK